MTAVVGILNKHAIALAADSAVTIGSSNGRKIFNKANKVFALSKFHPIGVMIFNAASFMETPWETIIKIYRKEIKEKAFATLLEYQHDFINFLKDKKYFADEVVQANFLESFASEIINSIVREIVNQNKQLIENPTIENQGSLQLILERHLDILIEKWGAKANPCEDFSGYTFESFMSYSNQIFEKIFHIIFVVNNFIPSEAVLSKIKYLVYHILISKEDKTSYTGLIFCGFGEEEIYPQLISLNISIVVDHRLRFYIDEQRSASISNENTGAVCPFAQTDVIDTILTGIDPLLDNSYLENFEALLRKYNEAILALIKDESSLLFKQIQKINPSQIIHEYNVMNRNIKWKNYINPLMDAVSSLSKEDLAEMAESLIYLTYLKRRITFAEESVGGPVDVAVISKGDGFIWIKRKQYFQQALNQSFLINYF